MIVRLGYVSISKTLEISNTFKTITYKNYEKDKLDSIIKYNLNNLDQILTFNIKNSIEFYRISSNLIPLATHNDIEFDYINPYINIYNSISKKIKDNNLRVDFHITEYGVLNSVRKEVIESTINILKYHYNLLKALKICNSIVITHIGSNAFGKDNSIKRFINNFYKLPNNIRNIIAIENDDKIFNIEDTLYLCKILERPMILDYHHHLCNKSDKDISFYIEDILDTWKDNIPKVHFSSPKNNSKKDFRSHNDYIDVDSFINFIEFIKRYTDRIDIMLEAKMKDEALFRLVRCLKYKTNYKFINDTSFIA